VGYATGDVFRIAVEGGVVKYAKNGVVFYTSVRAVSYPLVAAASFIAIGGTISNAVMAATNGTLAMSDAPLSTHTTTVLAATVATRNGRAPLAVAGYCREAMDAAERRGLAARLRELMIA
jgi:hypothetical protein